MKWQPTETAPRDSTSIIGWELENEVHVMSWWGAERCSESYEEGWYDSDANQMAPRFWILYQSPFVNRGEESK